jgi:hypothetical protein
MSDSVIVATIGIAGAVIGSVATTAGNLALKRWQDHVDSKREMPQKKLLLQMLDNEKYPWRQLETLMHVIGANEATTKRLLLEVGARASEDGQLLWGLISRNPLP